MSITPASIKAVFDATAGLDPLFRNNDGTDSPSADQSSLTARRAASSMLLNKGLLRIGIGIPSGAEFELAQVDDPYGFASAKELSLFRRPLPGANLNYLNAVMWDGRESPPGRSLQANLTSQALDATLGHAQADHPPTSQQLRGIVALERSISAAQIHDEDAGKLDAGGALGGPASLFRQEFYIGINDPLGGNPTGAAFNPEVFTLYPAWLRADGLGGGTPASRAAVARGEELFNTRTFTVSGVAGLNDRIGVPSLKATCTTCHDSPNIGNHSVVFPVNIGLTDASRRTPDLPLYTLRNLKTGDTVQTTDPGRALVTGHWADIGKFKGPVLRNLAARPPYFHNGLAATLDDVVSFYDTRFTIGLTAQEKADLAAFLRCL
jgi:hypothetical protein